MVNAYLNMKLSNPEDKRPMWKFKFSCIDHGVDQSHELGLRKRKRTENKSGDMRPARERKRRKNPHKCILGTRYSQERKLLAAKFCEETEGRRQVSLSDYFGTKGKRLQCARCGRDCSWGCLGCGVALNIKATTSRENRSPVSCMDVCHTRWKYNLISGSVMR